MCYKWQVILRSKPVSYPLIASVLTSQPSYGYLDCWPGSLVARNVESDALIAAQRESHTNASCREMGEHCGQDHQQPGRSGTVATKPPPSSSGSGETITGYSRRFMARSSPISFELLEQVANIRMGISHQHPYVPVT